MTRDELVLRHYYFPVPRAKHIPLHQIVSITAFPMSWSTGRLRWWGTSYPTYWMPLDMSRTHKNMGFVLDIGRHVYPAITPDRPLDFQAAAMEGGISLPHGGTVPG